jgi:hypothetical protein
MSHHFDHINGVITVKKVIMGVALTGTAEHFHVSFEYNKEIITNEVMIHVL